MNVSKTPYEAPTLWESGDVVAATRHSLVSNIEADMTGRDPFGSVGFGV